MRVVVVNDCAYVMEDMMPFLQEQFDVTFIKRSRNLWDKSFGLLWKILCYDGDLFHVNYALQDAFFVHKFKQLNILHIHGMDVKRALFTRKYGWIVRGNLNKAGKVVCSTEDVLSIVKDYREDALLLPRPVRTDVFRGKTEYGDEPVAVYFPKWYDVLPSGLIMLLKEKGIALTIQKSKIPYGQMPSFLRRFDIFVDQFVYGSVSKTCLEAMSCGLATITVSHKDCLASYIEELADSEKLRKFGNANRQFVVGGHDARVVALKLGRVWNDCLTKQ